MAKGWFEKTTLESVFSGREGQTERIFLFVNLVDFTDFRQEKQWSEKAKWSDDFAYWASSIMYNAIVQPVHALHAIRNDKKNWEFTNKNRKPVKVI